ncbi:hypothetical protein HK405_002507, partial [Cladochytrium tenue]
MGGVGAGSGGNRHSSLGFLAPLSNYFSSQWSFAQFSLQVPARCICAFADADRAGGGADAARRGIAGVRASAATAAASRTLPSSSSSSAAATPVTTAATDSTRPHSATTAWSPPPAVAPTAVVVLCADGTLHKFAFDPARGGDGVRESYHRFYRGPADDDGGLGFAAPPSTAAAAAAA